MKIELLEKMGDDLMVANVARVSFGKWKDNLDDKDVKLINYLATHEHTSPFRHPQIQLRCEAPLFIARQLQKHQVGLAWNEVSRRYVDDEPEFYYPFNEWRFRPSTSIKQGSGELMPAEDQARHSNDYCVAVDTCLAVYEGMLEAGVAPEQARMVLPQSMYTSWIWTGSLQAFHHVYRLRIEEHAQKEAQDFARMLGEIIEPVFPNCWGALNG